MAVTFFDNPGPAMHVQGESIPTQRGRIELRWNEGDCRRVWRAFNHQGDEIGADWAPTRAYAITEAAICLIRADCPPF